MRDNFGRFVYTDVAWNYSLHSVIEAEVLTLKEAIRGVIAMQCYLRK